MVYQPWDDHPSERQTCWFGPWPWHGNTEQAQLLKSCDFTVVGSWQSWGIRVSPPNLEGMRTIKKPPKMEARHLQEAPPPDSVYILAATGCQLHAKYSIVSMHLASPIEFVGISQFHWLCKSLRLGSWNGYPQQIQHTPMYTTVSLRYVGVSISDVPQKLVFSHLFPMNLWQVITFRAGIPLMPGYLSMFLELRCCMLFKRFIFFKKNLKKNIFLKKQKLRKSRSLPSAWVPPGPNQSLPWASVIFTKSSKGVSRGFSAWQPVRQSSLVPWKIHHLTLIVGWLVRFSV